MARAIRAALKASVVESVHVSSDSPDILDTARRWGADTIERPPELAEATTSSEAALLHALDVIGLGGPDAVAAMIQCTAPFVTGNDIDAVVAPVLAGVCDSTFSAVRHHGFLWRVDENGAAFGVNHDAGRPRQRRQDAPLELLETGAVYAMRPDAFRRDGTRFCGLVQAVALDRPRVEIDGADDLRRAETLAMVEDISAVSEARLQRVRAVAMDFDGVHTDGRVFVAETGDESVVCDRRDGFGLEQLRLAGFRLVIVSRERNQVVARRAAKLGVQVMQGVDDKVGAVAGWLAAEGLDWADLVFVGDDLPDAPCMTRAGLGAAPCDAHPIALRSADFILPAAGGRGALRALADWLLSVRR